MAFEVMEKEALRLGSYKAKVVSVADIKFDINLRKACEANYCGNYGRNYACPPFIGSSEELIERAKKYAFGLVFQTVTEIEDSYDFEGMMEAADHHQKLADQLEKVVEKEYPNYLLLTAGACNRCAKCGQLTGEACRMPEKMVSSVEAYCMDCAQLASISDMNYMNGADTVTYFGLILFS